MKRRNSLSILQISLTSIILCTFLFCMGCAGVLQRALHDTPNGVNKSSSNSKSAGDRDAALSPIHMSDLKAKEIDFLPLVPSEGENEPDAITPDTSPDGTLNAEVQSRFDKSLEFYQDSQEYWQQGDLEKALDSLDHAYALIINTDTADNPKFSQQKDDIRFMISKRILEIYASRYTTVKGNHNAIQMVMNRHVEKEIKEFMKSPECHNFFINSYKRSGRYRPYIVKELKKAGLPEELSWLPLIESGFKTNALSNARALGLWQFIASTGYKFGLKRDRYVDERLDPYKSTDAAIQYLKELHEIFGDWKTALAAYNCGAGRVLQLIRDQHINYLDDFWDLYQRLPQETARYVPKFLATLQIVKHLKKYNMADIKVDAPVEFATVKFDKQVSLKAIAKATDINEDELIRLNPELRYKVLPDTDYELKVPPGDKKMVLAKIDQIPEYYQSPNNIAYHRVRPGETLSAIALRYHTTAAKIAWYNNLYRKSYIVAGQMLKIPQSGAFAARGKPAAAPRIVRYRVRRGDSLWTLARRYNTTTSRIKRANHLRSADLYIGQILKVPTGGKYAGLDVYHVQRGDSPISIAQQHNMDLDRLLRLNNLSRHSKIYPGQALYVEQ